MIFKEILDKKEWDTFVQMFEHASFLQSWSWGEFQKIHGNIPRYLGVYTDGQLVGASLLIRVASKRGAYIECIGGPLFSAAAANVTQLEPIFDEWLRQVKKICKKEKVSFFRLRMPYQDTQEGRAFLQNNSFKETKLYYQAETTRIVGLEDSEQELLSKMDKQTRYDVRRAERDGVSVTRTNGNELFDTFITLYSDMVERHGYVGYSEKYLRSQWDIFSSENDAQLYVAYFDNEPVATAMIFYYGDTVTYHHAASVPVDKVSPMSLLLWQVFQDAQAEGYAYVDLFGTAPPDERYSSRRGLTKFKEGFGGYDYQWLRTHDLVLDRVMYTFSKLIEMIPGNLRALGAQVMRPR